MTVSFVIKENQFRLCKDMTEAGKVIYIGTFSKSIAPAIRMSYLVLPERVCSLYKKTVRIYQLYCIKSRSAYFSEIYRKRIL